MTTTEITTAWRVLAIEAGVAARLRRRDDAGSQPRITTDAEGGAPLRCCLRPARPGERIALVTYAPLRHWARLTGADPGPYQEAGPVFIHPQACGGQRPGGYPAALHRTHRVLRAYSADGEILGGRLTQPDEVGDQESAARVIAGMFAGPDVALLHVRAVEFGCFLFEIRRAQQP